MPDLVRLGYDASHKNAQTCPSWGLSTLIGCLVKLASWSYQNALVWHMRVGSKTQPQLATKHRPPEGGPGPRCQEADDPSETCIRPSQVPGGTRTTTPVSRHKLDLRRGQARCRGKHTYIQIKTSDQPQEGVGSKAQPKLDTKHRSPGGGPGPRRQEADWPECDVHQTHSGPRKEPGPQHQSQQR